MGKDLYFVIGKIGLRGGNLRPVIDKEEGAEELLAQANGQIAANPRDDRGTENEYGDGGGQDAPKAAHPKVLQANRSGRAVLAHEQRGNKEAGEDEEHVHAQVTAG